MAPRSPDRPEAALAAPRAAPGPASGGGSGAHDSLEPLPPPPTVELEVVRDRSAESAATGGFVDLRRVDMVARYDGGLVSDPFAYDAAVRAGMDAIVVLAWRRVDAERRVYLRSAVRAPIALRAGMAPVDFNLWEVPAGIVDPGETPREAAARELAEELGFDVDAARLVELGRYTWPAPGLIAERHHYFTIDVTLDVRGIPGEDGSPLERAARIIDLPVDELLARCRRGELPDAKSELAIRRFAELP